MMLTFIEDVPDHITSLFRSSDYILIPGDFNIPWNKSENPDAISMEGILDMYEKEQHIHIKTHNLGNITDLLLSNTINII